MRNWISSFLAGLYTWLVTILFGLVFLDRMYANKLRNVLGLSNSEKVFSDLSDSLLFVYFIVVIAGAVAIVATWQVYRARNLFIVSILVLLLELVIPVIAGFINVSEGLSGLRLLPSGAASILAFAGLYAYYRGGG